MDRRGPSILEGMQYSYWWECKLVQPLWRTVWCFLRKLKTELPYALQSHSWAYTWRSERTHALQCSLQNSLQQSRHGGNLNIHKQKTGSRCGTYIQWNITQPLKIWNNATCNNMDGPRNDHTKWSESNREIYHRCHLYMESKKNVWKIYKAKTD